MPEVGADGEFTYELRAGDKIAIRVRNRSNAQLKVTLLNSAASGRVEYLGDQIIDPRAHCVFWHSNTRGRPFSATTPRGADQGIDRLVAIGTNEYGKDLRYLKLNSTFADVLKRNRGGVAKDFADADLQRPPIEQWTANHVVVRCRRGG